MVLRLGHFLLHDTEIVPQPLFEDLLAGYREVVAVPADHNAQIRRSGILLGTRQLFRWLDRGMPTNSDLVGWRLAQLSHLLSTEARPN